MSLTLTFKEEDFVNISGPVTVTIVKISGKQIRLAFDCDRSVSVKRSTLKTEVPIKKEYGARSK